MQRGASMTTDKHVDPAAAVPVGDEEEDSNLQDVPEGAVRFELDRGEIEEALAAPSMQVICMFASSRLECVIVASMRKACAPSFLGHPLSVHETQGTDHWHMKVALL